MMLTCPNGLFKTYLVSYPRSGHHLMQRGLDAALGHKLVYSEFYNCVHNFETCEYVNLQKSHDFDLALPIRDDMKYIILVRNKDDAENSWLDSGSLHKYLVFKDFFGLFYDKWVAQPPANAIKIRYEEFVKNKLETIIKAAQFMGCTQPDYANIGEWLKREERFK